MNTLSSYALCGERCSGTNWIDNLIQGNFEVKQNGYFGFKHWPTFKNQKPQNHLNLFLVRNGIDWLKSFSKDAHHVKRRARKGLLSFMYDRPFKSLIDQKIVIEEDKNIFTPAFYHDLWDLRKNKHLDWMKKEPVYIIYPSESIVTSNVSNVWIRYEDILENPELFITFLEKIGLKRKSTDINVIDTYKFHKDRVLDQNEHKHRQMYWNPQEAANWLLSKLSRGIVLRLLINLISCEFENKIGYNLFYKRVFDVINSFKPT